MKPLLKKLTIQTKNLETRRFDLDYIHPTEGDLGWAQREFIAEIEDQYNAGKPVRIIVLKARQLGISTATGGVLFNWAFLHPGTNGIVITHENVASHELFEKTKLFWETWPFRKAYTLKYATKQHLNWLETRSKLRIATAKNIQGGRGSTLHAVHASEVAFYPDPETLWTGLRQTIPHKHGSIVILESTANGMGNWFHNEWMASEDGDSDYIPMFFPWWKHPEYMVHTTLATHLELDPDEKEIYRMCMKHDQSREVAFQHIAWRRWALVNLVGGDFDGFMQEYPSTPEEAFVTSGQPIFSRQFLQQIYKKERGFLGTLIDDPTGPNGVRWVPDPDGQLRVFRRPARFLDDRWDRYFVAGDPSETVSGDPACIQVINRQTNEQVAVWHGRIDPMAFADVMMRVGKFYNNAMLCPEIEGGGQATVARILTCNYPNVWMHRWADKAPGKVSVSYGWSTNYNRKMWAIGMLQRLIVDKSLTIHDSHTFSQFLAYVQREDGSLGNGTGNTHDDAVMAMAIAVTASGAEGPYVVDNPNNNKILDIYRQEFEEDGMFDMFGATT